MSLSPINCREPWKSKHKMSESEPWLEEMGFYRKHIARDSSCLFRAVSENIYNSQKYFHKVRLDCVEFMASKRQNFEGSLNCPFENYLKELANPSVCGGLVEISAMSLLYRHDFLIFEANKGPQTKICNGYGDTIFLFYSPETKHFDAVYTKEYIYSSSFCQSLVYEILYDGVYQMKDLKYAVDKMLHHKIPSNNNTEYITTENVERRKKQKERAKIFIELPNDEDKKDNETLSLKCKHHTEDIERAILLKESLRIFVFQRSLVQLSSCMNCLNVNSAKDLLDNGITPFPYKVAKVLDPDIYRNIEFDVWSEMRRETRYNARYSDGTTLQVGVRCLVKNPDQSTYHCHIQEMRTDGGTCLVFIEELGEKQVVELGQLETLPLDEVRPWAPPYRHSRANSQFLMLNQMFQQTGSINRKQGLNKRKAKYSEDIKVQNKSSRPPKLIWKNGKDAEMPFTHSQHDVEEMNVLYQGDHVKQVDEIINLPTENSVQEKWQTEKHQDLFDFELTTPAEASYVPLIVECRDTSPQLDMNSPNNDQETGASGGLGASCATASASGLLQTSPPHPLNNPYEPSVLTGGMSNDMPYMASYSSCNKPTMCVLPPQVAPFSTPFYKSMQPNGSDLPFDDIPTLRYFFNLGVDCMMDSYGSAMHPEHYKHYYTWGITRDMQQMSLHNRDNDPNKHKPASQRPPGSRNLYQNPGSQARAYECPAEPIPLYTPNMYPVYYPMEDPGVAVGMPYYNEFVDYNHSGAPLYPYYPPVQQPRPTPSSTPHVARRLPVSTPQVAQPLQWSSPQFGLPLESHVRRSQQTSPPPRVVQPIGTRPFQSSSTQAVRTLPSPVPQYVRTLPSPVPQYERAMASPPPHHVARLLPQSPPNSPTAVVQPMTHIMHKDK